MRSITMIVVASTLTSACMSNPATHAADNGLPARLLIVSGTGVRDVEVQAGRNVYTNTAGEQSETVRYKTVKEKFNWKDWGFFQGRDRLDEQDWFKLRDPAASAEIEKARSRAYREQMIGLPMAVVGIAGASLLQAGVGSEQLGSAASTASIAFYALAAGGTFLFGKGLRTMRKKRLLPLSRAYEAADEVSQCRGPRRCVTVKGSAERAGTTR